MGTCGIWSCNEPNHWLFSRSRFERFFEIRGRFGHFLCRTIFLDNGWSWKAGLVIVQRLQIAPLFRRKFLTWLFDLRKQDFWLVSTTNWDWESGSEGKISTKLRIFGNMMTREGPLIWASSWKVRTLASDHVIFKNLNKSSTGSTPLETFRRGPSQSSRACLLFKVENWAETDGQMSLTDENLVKCKCNNWFAKCKNVR